MPEFKQHFDISVIPTDMTPRPDLTLPENRLRNFAGVEVVYTDEPGIVCPGGKDILSDCQTAQEAASAAREAAQKSHRIEERGDTWTSYAWAMGKKCVECNVQCEAAVLVRDGEPTDLVRLSFIEPDDSIPTLHIDLNSYTLKPADLTEEEIKAFQDVVSNLGKSAGSDTPPEPSE